MRVLVLGSNGMAGHVISMYLNTLKVSVETVARKNSKYNLDIENVVDLKKLKDIVDNDYDFIINCIGLLVKDSNDNPDRAIYINSWFPHHLEQLLKNKKTKLIHLSTDCVFDGSKGNYIETELHTETNFYGRSKSLGEINNNKDITFRMSIIGPELKNGTGLMNWILKNPSKEISGWENALWNGITTLELAKCISKYLFEPKITGIYHLVSNENEISKYELLKLINDIYDLKKNIVKVKNIKEINKVLIDTRQEFDFKIPPYQKMLIEMRNFQMQNKNFYQ